MTIQEAKDKVAKDHGWDDLKDLWADYFDSEMDEEDEDDFEEYINEVAILFHATQIQKQTDAIEFAEWLLKKGSGEANPISRKEDTEKLYKAFLLEKKLK